MRIAALTAGFTLIELSVVPVIIGYNRKDGAARNYFLPKTRL